jgi:hypothetical protein
VTGCLALLSSVLVAIVSWRLVETPVRHRAVLKTRSVLVGSALAGAVALCLVGVTLRFDGFRWRYTTEFLAIAEVPYGGHGRGAVGSDRVGWKLPVIGDPSAAQTKPRFLLLGDSYAKCMSAVCDDVARECGVKGYDAGLGGTPPLLNTWSGTETRAKSKAFHDFVFEFARQEEVRWLILVAGWDIHAHGMSQLKDGEGGSSFDAFKRGFEATLERAESLGMKVAVVLQPPYQGTGVPARVARNVVRGNSGMIYGISRARHAEYQALAHQFFLTLGDRIKIVDASDYIFAEDGMSIIGRDGIPFYSDGHPSREGTRVFFQAPLRKLFSEIAAQ